MRSTIVNLTLLKVTEELENILEFDLDSTTQDFFADTDLRQKLIAYVLQRVPNRYLTIESVKKTLSISQITVFTTIERLKIEDLIYQRIYQLLHSQDKGDFFRTYKPMDLACYA